MKKKLAKWSAVLLTFLMMVMVIGPVSAFATDTETPTKNASKTDIEDILNKGNASTFKGAEKVVTDTGASIRKIVIAVAVFLLVIGLIITGLQLASRNSQKRQAAKENIVWLIVGACVVFGSVAILIFSQNIAETFGNSIKDTDLIAVARTLPGLFK